MNEILARRLERKTKRRAASRSAILESARRVAAREGEGELSLRSVAAEAGYAPASVYEYFRNRAELVLALAAEDLGLIAKQLREAEAGAGALGILFEAMRGSGPLAAAVAALESREAPADAERAFNGKTIAALTAFAEGLGMAPVKSREDQADVVLAASAIMGLAILARTGRLKALGFEEAEVLARLARYLAGAR